jgi:UDP-N-acetyl-D-glucosamine dehydrogenase
LDTDYFLAYSPEREDPGNANYSTSRIPKVVGGIDAASQELAARLYSQAVVEVVPVSSCEVAEACKILENVYRCVNIALVNELKLLFDKLGIDVWEVIDAAKTKPFGFQAFYPGPGLGGHCIPIDPFYLSWLARERGQPTRFIELAGEINAAMPEYVVAKIAAALAERNQSLGGSKVAILGVAYKRDVDDPRESPAFRILELLAERGAVLSYHDPHIPRLPKMRHYRVPDLASQPLTPAYLADQDCIVIVTDHSAVDYAQVVQHARLVVDTRNATARVAGAKENVRRA